MKDKESIENIWNTIQDETQKRVKAEPVLASFFHTTILEHSSFSAAIADLIANDLGSSSVQPMMLRSVIKDAINSSEEILEVTMTDLIAAKEKDPSCKYLSEPLLFFKGFKSLQSHRVASWLWENSRHTLAHYFQSRTSEVYGVDIHPAAKIGKGLMIDHAHSIVIGETSVVGDNVSMLHSVTLGGTGKQEEDRHPKIGDGVMIGAGAKVLGNIKIGNCCRIAAGSVVLQEIPPKKTVAGVPAKIVGEAGCSTPSIKMDQILSSD